MVCRKVMSRLALIALVLVTVAAIGCSSGRKSHTPDPTPTPTPTGIKGTVFQDLDGDGLKGATETGVANVVVSNGVSSTTTDATGSFTLPKEGSFVFVTTPSGYAASGSWYRDMSDTQVDMGLKLAPERSSDDFTFIHMTDIHLDDADLASFNQAVEEFKKVSPAFIVSTGDLVNEGDKTTISETQATQWFDKYQKAISSLETLGIPVYNGPGNHDMANLACETAAGATAGCSKSGYRNAFGPTYYSFDWGKYHCVVLDPNSVSAGSQVFQLSATEFAWLQKDLSYRPVGSPLLVFMHEATASWQGQSQSSLLNLLKQYDTRIFATMNSHDDLLMDSQGIPEQVTAAVSGEWGHGDNPNGSKPGYRIVTVAGGSMDSFYKAIGSTQQIELSPAGSTWPIVNGQLELVAKVYSEGGPVTAVTYSVDNAAAVAMTLSSGSKWATARVTWDTTSLTQDYHKVTITATDSAASFQVNEEVKVSDETILTVKDLQDHLRVYQGHYVTIKGTVEMAMFNTGFAPVGAGGARIVDSTGTALIYAGECYSPALPTIDKGTTVQVRVIPMRFTWAFMTTTVDREGTFDQFALQEGMGMIPSGQKEDDNGTKVARWFMRLVTADGIKIL